MFTVYDTETQGLPPKKMHYTDPKYPRLVQLAISLIGDDGIERACFHAIIKPDGWVIPDETAEIHGITTELAERVGIPVRVALAAFCQVRALAPETFAHNEQFDFGIVESEIHRLGIMTKPWPKRLCTAQTPGIAEAVGLPPTEAMKRWPRFANKNKTPNLQELHTYLFGEGFEGAHDAMVDVRACGRCAIELRKRVLL